MKLTKLQIENFRNYAEYSYEFPGDKNIIIILGENGKGKTNILEAIYLLSLTRSFRTCKNEDLIEWGKDYYRCNAGMEFDGEEVGLEIFYSHKPEKKKVCKKNGMKLNGSEYVGNLLTVLFHPENLNILYLNPLLRRKYLNILLSQTDKSYLDALSNYKKIRKQRNILLEQIREARMSNRGDEHLLENLEAWNQQLIDFGSEIIEKRALFVGFLNNIIQDIYQSISYGKEKVKVRYKSNILEKQDLKDLSGLDQNRIKERFQEKIQENSEKEINYARTILGSHRDDLVFYIDDKEISRSASRGEFRSILLALKLAEIAYIKEQMQENPVVLLDDVFSELDPERQKHLLESIKDCQTIITTTDLSHLDGVEAEVVEL